MGLKHENFPTLVHKLCVKTVCCVRVTVVLYEIDYLPMLLLGVSGNGTQNLQ